MEFFRSGTNRGRKKKRDVYIHGVQYTFRALVIDGIKIRHADIAGGVRARDSDAGFKSQGFPCRPSILSEEGF